MDRALTDRAFVIVIAVAAAVFAIFRLLRALNVIGSPNWASLWPLAIPMVVFVALSIYWGRTGRGARTILLWVSFGSALFALLFIFFLLLTISMTAMGPLG